MPHTPRGTNYVLRINVKPRNSFTVNGTVPLKPLYKGQVGCVRAFVSSNVVTDQTELDDSHLAESIATHDLVGFEQSLEDQLAQFYKAWVKVKAVVVLWQIYEGCGLAVSPGKPRVPHCEERP